MKWAKFQYQIVAKTVVDYLLPQATSKGRQGTGGWPLQMTLVCEGPRQNNRSGQQFDIGLHGTQMSHTHTHIQTLTSIRLQTHIQLEELVNVLPTLSRELGFDARTTTTTATMRQVAQRGLLG